jgi:hypothetical protein
MTMGKINLGSIVKFEFKGRHLLGRVIAIEHSKFGKMITVACKLDRVGISEKNIIEVIR